MECYSAIKRNDSDICNTLDGPQKNYTYKKTSKCYILYDSIYITFLKWQIIMANYSGFRGESVRKGGR